MKQLEGMLARVEPDADTVLFVFVECGATCGMAAMVGDYPVCWSQRPGATKVS